MQVSVRLRKGFMWVIGAVLLVLTVTSAGARTISLVMGRGPSVQHVDFDIGRVMLKSGRCVSVEVGGRRVILTPLEPGHDQLTLFDADGQNRGVWSIVVSDRPRVDCDAVEALLIDENGNKMPTLHCSPIPGTDMVRITGTIMQEQDLERVRAAMVAFEGSVVNLTRIAPVYFEHIAQKIRQNVELPGIQVSHAGSTVFLRGLAFDEREKAHAEAVARAIYPEVQNFITVRRDSVPDFNLERPLIQLETQIIEIKTSAAEAIGIDWRGIPLSFDAAWKTETGRGAGGTVSFQTKALAEALLPQIKSGNARLLHTQNLVCEHGEEARFFVGGTFWIVAQAQGGDISTEEVEYGIIMEMLPLVDKFGNIQTKVNVEFSTLGEKINDYPSLLKRYVRTSVNVKRGQTLILGALLGSEMRESVKKIPALADIPVLGELFKSKDYLDGRSEMAMLITPRIVVPGDPENVALREALEGKMQVPTERVRR